jgi:hypothetical protein
MTGAAEISDASKVEELVTGDDVTAVGSPAGLVQDTDARGVC